MKDQSDHMDQIDHHYNTCTLQARNLRRFVGGRLQPVRVNKTL